MKRKIPIVVFILAATLAVCGQQLAATLPAHGQELAALPSHITPPRPVARVNGAVLTDRDLLFEMYAIFPYAKQHNGFPKAMEADIRRGAMRMIEFEELVYQEAQRRNITVAPERLAKAERQFRQQFETEQQYREFLQVEDQGSRQILRTKIRRSLLIEDLLKSEITDKSHVTIAEARAFYGKYPERFKAPETYALQTITIMPPIRPSRQNPNPPPPTADQLKQMKARAEDALRQVQATKDYEEFGLLAEKISEDDYRVMMGDHKTKTVAELPPEIVKAASTLQSGQISGLILTENAYTIIRLNQHDPARMQKFDEVSKTLQAQIQVMKKEMLQKELDSRLRKKAKVEEL
ncbi:MAG TPA: peptidyl-prolyl cis-trans isomerase [Terriglobales bacterium]|nr:peptidyl-prolyl cis-trans isomerase [Terriglobales bacterium]